MLSLNEELDRLSTFRDWPSTVPAWPSELAKHGFYYTGHGDVVKCYRCSMEVADWNRGDVPLYRHGRSNPRGDHPPDRYHPLARHRRRNPDCPVVTETDTLNAIVHMRRSVSTLEPDDVQQLIPLINRFNPSVLAWQNLRSNSFRQPTFHDWPKKDIVSVLSLSRAGFFYTGNGDMVRCAFCRRDFINWRAGDIPTEEHQRGVPYCPFVVENFCLPEQLLVSGHQHQTNEQV